MNTREQVIQIAAELRSIAQEWREDGYSNLAYTLDRKAAALRAAVEPIERERERAAIESDIFCDQAAWGSTPAYKGPEMNADSQAKIESDMRDSAANVCDRFTYSGFKQSVRRRLELLKFADRLAALPRAEETRWLSLDEAHLALWKAIGAIKFGLKTDDKLILANLRDAGVSLARFYPPPPAKEST